MKKVGLFQLSLVLFILSLSFSTWAQDGCCIVKRSGEGNALDTSAIIVDRLDCKPGDSVQEDTACRWDRDEQNLCAETPKSTQCEACGGFWSGETCLKEDPMKKTEKLVEEKLEEFKETLKEKDKGQPSYSAPSATPAPKATPEPSFPPIPTPSDEGVDQEEDFPTDDF